MFEALQAQPPDKIFALMQAYRDDPRESKVDLGQSRCTDSSKYHKWWDCRRLLGINKEQMYPFGFSTNSHSNRITIFFAGGEMLLLSRIVIQQALYFQPGHGFGVDKASECFEGGFP